MKNSQKVFISRERNPYFDLFKHIGEYYRVLEVPTANRIILLKNLVTRINLNYSINLNNPYIISIHDATTPWNKRVQIF